MTDEIGIYPNRILKASQHNKFVIKFFYLYYPVAIAVYTLTLNNILAIYSVDTCYGQRKYKIIIAISVKIHKILIGGK